MTVQGCVGVCSKMFEMFNFLEREKVSDLGWISSLFIQRVSISKVNIEEVLMLPFSR